MKIDEQAVICSILMDAESIVKVHELLTPDMFTNEMCKAAYEMSVHMYINKREISHITLRQALINKDYSDEIIGEFLRECLASETTSAYIESHAEVIKADYEIKKVKEKFNSFDFSPSEYKDEIRKIMSFFNSMLTNGNNSSNDLQGMVDIYKEDYFIDVPQKRMLTGFQTLDSKIQGLQGGEVMIIGARPGVGKSAISTQIITNVAEQGFKVGYFNLEMSEKQIYERMVSRLSGIGLTRIKNAKAFLGDEEEKFNKANDRLRKMKIYICSKPMKISDIQLESRYMGFDLIVIDYLQLVKPDINRQNRATEVGEISKGIKELAMSLNIPIIAISQLNRENTDESEPSISDLRESGDIEQDASVICLMWNEKIKGEYTGVKGFKIGKNRQGELARFGVKFDGNLMEFTECELGKTPEKNDTPF